MIRSLATLLPAAQSRTLCHSSASLSAAATTRLIGKHACVAMSLSHNGRFASYSSSSAVMSKIQSSFCNRPKNATKASAMMTMEKMAPPFRRQSVFPLSSSSSLSLSQQYSRQGGSRRFYTPMTPEEEEKEKARVLYLSPEEKDQELRKLNRELSRLEKLKGINTGELYKWSGRYKALLRDYGLPLFAYYWVCYGTMGLGVYTCITVGGLDAMDVIARVDGMTGFHLAEKVDPELGKIGLVLILNEMLEPVRLPFVVVTLKPILDVVSPPKY